MTTSRSTGPFFVAALALLLWACAPRASARPTPTPLPTPSPVETPQAAAVSSAVSSDPSSSPVPDRGPVTAEEAAQLELASATAEAGACQTDDDCAFTQFDEGACCPLLCTPRPVAKSHAAALAAHASSCTNSGHCPQPPCMAPRQQTRPACEAGRCSAKVVGPRQGDPRNQGLLL